MVRTSNSGNVKKNLLTWAAADKKNVKDLSNTPYIGSLRFELLGFAFKALLELKTKLQSELLEAI